MSRLLVRDIAQLVTPSGDGAPLRGRSFGEVTVVEDAYVLTEGSRIAAVGRMRDLAPLDGLALRLVLMTVGLVLIAAGSGLYIGAGLGPGPRDGLMTGLSRRSIAGRPISVRVARTFIEVVVLLVGIALGGAVGIGTVAFTLGIGPLVHVFLPPLTMDGPIGDVDVDPLSGDVVDPLTGETPTVP